MTKKLRYIRHADKDQKTNLISPAGFKNITERLPPGEYTDIFFGKMIRARQCAVATRGLFGLNNKPRLHLPLPEIGNLSLFSLISGKEEYRRALRKGGGPVEALFECFSSWELEDLQKTAASGIKKCFPKMEFNSFGLAIGHTPFISLAALHFGKGPVELDFWEYIDFIQQDGKITAL